MSETYDITVFFLTGSLNAASGGRAQSIFSRARLLGSACSRAIILTVDFKPDYSTIYTQISERYGFSENVLFHNFHEFLSGESYSSNINGVIGASRNHPSCQKIFRESQDEACQERYYDSRGRLYLIRTNDKSKGIYSCHWIKKDGTERVFPTLRSLRQYWIYCLNNRYPNAVFSLENRHYDSLVIENQYDDSLKSVAVVHGNHLSAPFTFGSKLTDYLSPMMNRLNLYDGVVFLTEEQRHYVANQFGPRLSHLVIPHPLSVDTSKSMPKTHNDKSIVLLARLVGLKRVDHAIRAMRKVVDFDRSINLSIYGIGDKKDDLIELVNSLGLQQNVAFKGYTDNPEAILSGASISIMTSQTEALCLSVLESLALGTPVVSYDCNFGPADLIVDGENGRLVPSGKIDALADAILDVLEDDKKLFSMSKRALELSHDYSDEVIVAKWKQALLALTDTQYRTNRLASSHPAIDRVDITSIRLTRDELANTLLVDVSFGVSGLFSCESPVDFFLASKDSCLFGTFNNMYVQASSVSHTDGEAVAYFSLAMNLSTVLALLDSQEAFFMAVRQHGEFFASKNIPNFLLKIITACFDEDVSRTSSVDLQWLLSLLERSGIAHKLDLRYFKTLASDLRPGLLSAFMGVCDERDFASYRLNSVSGLKGGKVVLEGDLRADIASDARYSLVIEGSSGAIECSDISFEYKAPGTGGHLRAVMPAGMVFGLVPSFEKCSLKVSLRCVLHGRIWASKQYRCGILSMGPIGLLSYKGKKAILAAWK